MKRSLAIVIAFLLIQIISSVGVSQAQDVVVIKPPVTINNGQLMFETEIEVPASACEALPDVRSILDGCPVKPYCFTSSRQTATSL